MFLVIFLLFFRFCGRPSLASASREARQSHALYTLFNERKQNREREREVGDSNTNSSCIIWPGIFHFFYLMPQYKIIEDLLPSTRGALPLAQTIPHFSLFKILFLRVGFNPLLLYISLLRDFFIYAPLDFFFSLPKCVTLARLYVHGTRSGVYYHV